MSYDPSHYQPPAQGRWPQATPPEAWPSYRDDDVYRDGERLDGQYGADRQGANQATAGYQRQIGYQRASGESGDHGYPSAVATDTFPPARNGYATADGYSAADGYGRNGNGYGAANGYADAGAGTRNGDAEPGDGYGPVVYASAGYAESVNGYAGAGDSFDGAGYGYGSSQNGYADTAGGYAPAADGYPGTVDRYAGAADGYADGYDWNGNGYGTVTDGFDGAQNDFTEPAGYPDRGGYTEPVPSEHSWAALAAPDADLDPDSWQAGQDRRRAAGQRGPAAGAVTGLLAVAVATGVSTLVAAFVRPQAAPVIAIGDVFIDRVPAGLRNAAMAQSGSHGRIALLLIMYFAIACVALGMGALSRRAAALGVASLAAFTLFSAFIVITRTGGRMTDVLPAILGGAAGAAALLWLQRASAPVAPYPHARSAPDRSAPDRSAPDRGGSRRRTP